MNTTLSEPTVGPGGPVARGESTDLLVERYNLLSQSAQIFWAAQYSKLRVLGRGGQGVVYLSERQGSDLFRLPVALKIFSPERYGDAAAYDMDVKGFVDLAFTDMPRIPLYQPYVNVAMQKNISGYQYWFHRRLDYRSFEKA